MADKLIQDLSASGAIATDTAIPVVKSGDVAATQATGQEIVDLVQANTTAADIGAVPASRTVNGEALSGDVTVTDANLSVSDVTTNDVSTAAHGFAPKGDGDTTKFLNANGAYSVPAGGGGGLPRTIIATAFEKAPSTTTGDRRLNDASYQSGGGTYAATSGQNGLSLNTVATGAANGYAAAQMSFPELYPFLGNPKFSMIFRCPTITSTAAIAYLGFGNSIAVNDVGDGSFAEDNMTGLLAKCYKSGSNWKLDAFAACRTSDGGSSTPAITNLLSGLVTGDNIELTIELVDDTSATFKAYKNGALTPSATATINTAGAIPASTLPFLNLAFWLGNTGTGSSSFLVQVDQCSYVR